MTKRREVYAPKRLVFGLGINDAGYAIEGASKEKGERLNGIQSARKDKWMCPFYLRWRTMLSRCYSQALLNRLPSYVGCSVCDEWLTFSNFKAWMQKQDWEGKQLDKDLLIRGNKVYSPETCVFVSNIVNCFINEGTKGRYLIGVVKGKNAVQFCAIAGDGTGSQIQLGYYRTEIEAHKAWLAYKIKRVKEWEESGSVDQRVIKSLLEHYLNYKIN